jgi:hypothetical protein
MPTAVGFPMTGVINGQIYFLRRVATYRKEKRMKLRTALAASIMLLATVFPAGAATSAASLKGTYNFQIINVSSPDASVGTLFFDGTGKIVEFKSFTQYNGSGGPVIGQNYGPYTVSGVTGTFTITGVTVHGVICGSATDPCPVLTLSLGSFNASNVAGTVLIGIFNTGDTVPPLGVGNLQ